MDDVGAESLEQPTHGSGGVGVPEGPPHDAQASAERQGVAGIGGHGRLDEDPARLDVRRGRRGEEADVVTTTAQDLGELEAVPIRAPRDVRELVDEHDSHRSGPAGLPDQ